MNIKINQVSTSSKAVALASILEAHKQVFSPGLGLLKGVQVHLSVKDDAQPVFKKARPVPYAMREKVAKELQRLEDAGVMKPVRYSNWAAPIVPVLKADKESVRLCGDFKLTVNPVANTEKYPLPKATDIFSQLTGEVRFTKLDLRDAYNQLELDEESRKLVVVNTHKGLYEYTRLPYGISSATAIFQRQMDTLLKGVESVSAFLDDVLVSWEDDDAHLRNLDETLTRIENAGLK